MNKSFVVVILLFSVLNRSPVLAQEKRLELRASGGIAWSLSPEHFKKYWSLALHLGAGLGYYLTPQLTVGGSISYSYFDLDVRDIPFQLENTKQFVKGGDINFIEIVGVVKYYLKSAERSANFYIFGGPGLSLGIITEFDVLRTTVGELTRGVNLMFTSGLGVRFRTSSTTGIFVEVRYNVLISEARDFSYLPLKVGIAL
jgi:hypothetical protein